MANPTTAELEVTTPADKVKSALAILCVIAGIAGFYVLGQQPTVVRIGSILLGLAAGALIAWFSNPGQRFFAFARESWSETRRVVWPTRKETIQMTLTVFGFVVVMALFLWLVDKAIEWLMYDLLLRLRK
jgi:preprotein translocase subunit SecE